MISNKIGGLRAEFSRDLASPAARMALLVATDGKMVQKGGSEVDPAVASGWSGGARALDYSRFDAIGGDTDSEEDKERDLASLGDFFGLPPPGEQGQVPTTTKQQKFVDVPQVEVAQVPLLKLAQRAQMMAFCEATWRSSK